MPCHAAMTDKFITAKEDETVEKLLKRMKKNAVTAAPVVNADGALIGMFSINSLLQNTAPITVPIAGAAGHPNMSLDSGPGIAKRLKKVKPLTVNKFMTTKFPVTYPETPTWEGLKLLLDGNSAIVVIDSESQKPLGLITEESMLNELERMQD